MNHCYEFGSLRLDATSRLLSRNGVELPLQPRLIETLIALVENPNAVVDKDSLIDAVWGETVVEEGGLKRNISMLRKALGDEGRFIETLPKRGYRFTAEVKETWHESSATTPSGIATELVLQRQTNLLMTCEEEITDSADSGRTTQAATAPTPVSVSRIPRPGLLTSAAVLLSLVLTCGYLVLTGKIGTRGSAATVKSIAVLPFKNLSVSRDDEHLGLGVADVVITRLNNLKDLNVRPTSAVLKYDEQEQDSTAIGRMLGVDAVLEGSIHQINGRLRVTARLVKVSDKSPIWAGQFDAEAKDLLALQDQISEQVADSLVSNLTGSEKAALTRRYTESADAYRLYVKGRYHWNKRSGEGMTQAEHFFRQAIEKDPNFALAYLGIADTLLTRAEPGESYKALEKALELDPNLGEAYATSGFADMFRRWDWQKAEENFKLAIKLNPRYGTAHQWYATLLAITGRVDEAKMEMRRALEIDPMSPNFLADLGQMHYFAREYTAAEAYCRKALEDYPDFIFAHQYLFDIYLKMGRQDEAFEEYLKWAVNQGFDSRYSNQTLAEHQATYRENYQGWGLNGILRARTEGSGSYLGHHYQLALDYARLGEKDRALDWLEKSCESREFLLAFVKADPVFDNLRSEPRFQSILNRMGLSQ